MHVKISPSHLQVQINLKTQNSWIGQKFATHLLLLFYFLSLLVFKFSRVRRYFLQLHENTHNTEYTTKITTWRSRSSQIAGSSTQQLLLCNNATFDDIILQHLMTSFWMTCTFWILNKQVKNSFLKLCTIFQRSSLDLDVDLDVI